MGFQTYRSPAIPAADDLAYDIWRARRDVDRLLYEYASRRIPVPRELKRLSDLFETMARTGVSVTPYTFEPSPRVYHERAS